MIEFSEIRPPNRVTVLLSTLSGKRGIGSLAESWHTKIWQMDLDLRKNWIEVPAIYRSMIVDKLAELNSGWRQKAYGDSKIPRAWRGRHHVVSADSEGRDLGIFMPLGTEAATIRSRAFGDRAYPADPWPHHDRYTWETIKDRLSKAKRLAPDESLTDPFAGMVKLSRATIPYEDYLDMAEWPRGSGNLAELTIGDTIVLPSGVVQPEMILAPARWTLSEMTLDFCAWNDVKAKHGANRKKSQKEKKNIKEQFGIDVEETLYKVCDRWRNSFEAFISDVGSASTEKVLALKKRVGEPVIDAESGFELRVWEPNDVFWRRELDRYEAIMTLPEFLAPVTYSSGSGLMINPKEG